MPDQNVREIQLGGKQLVFLFMASVVLAVAIFLLGISVGAGVGTPAAAVRHGRPGRRHRAGGDAAADETTPADLSYHDKLRVRRRRRHRPRRRSRKPSKTPSTTPAPTCSNGHDAQCR